MSAPDPVLVEAVGRVLDHHLPENAHETGCALRCGYGGDDLTTHLAEAILAPLLADQAEVVAQAKREALKEAATAYYDEQHAAGGDCGDTVVGFCEWLRDRAEAVQP